MQIENILMENMENYITRGVLDKHMVLTVARICPPHAHVVHGGHGGHGEHDNSHDHTEPIEGHENWPISVKRQPKDPRSNTAVNQEGEMDPLPLLLYAIEKMSFPSGEQLYKNFFQFNFCAQDYFIYLFWFIKLKFFQRDMDNDMYVILC